MSVDVSMNVEPIDATFGAVVTGVRLTELDESAWERLYAAWLTCGLLVFPGQFMTREEQVAFARRFGEIERFGDREIVPVSNVKPDGTVRSDDDVVKVLKGNMGWHADSTYMPVQAKGAVFTAEIVPDAGGETGWADMCAAYEALDEETRTKVDTLSAHHSLAHSQSKVGHTHTEGSDYGGYGFHGGPDPLRPLVKVHPETGRRSLLVGRHAYGIPGMSSEESQRMLDDLVAVSCQGPRVYHHRWNPGDAVVWDNRRLLHRARPWDMSKPRVMWHSRVAGDPASELASNADVPERSISSGKAD